MGCRDVGHTVEMSFLRGGGGEDGVQGQRRPPLPARFSWRKRGFQGQKRRGEKGEEFLVELPTGKMLGRNWLVCSGGRHAFTSQVRCQIPGQWVPPTPFSAAHLRRRVGAWRRPQELQGREGEDARSKVLAAPERPEDGRQLRPKSEAPPRGSSPRGARTAWGPSSGPCRSVSRAPQAPGDPDRRPALRKQRR